ncbi:MAG: 4Fe-4S binding protein [Kiritimatiellia bacterium]|nr:4Fe-4S binding protein [Kiritimatiellia bacterium]
MPTRKIIEIDEDLCNGCGACVTGCAEGALQIVNGKARLVKEQFCDGFGDCIGECPTGALTIVEREAPEFDEVATLHHVAKIGGEEAVRKFEAAAKAHESPSAPKPAARPFHPPHGMGGGCPGSRMRTFDSADAPAQPAMATGSGLPPQVQPSELRQWPIQIHLVPPGAPFFKNKELVVMSTCGPLASADVHWRFLRGRSVVVGCPKLDRTDGYAEKLAAILSEPSIPRVLIVRMEVPCCGGLTAIVEEAAALSGRRDLQVEEITLSLDGKVL